jgi:hypothetical protein
MRNIFCCLIMAGMLSGVFTGCAAYMDTAERYVLGAAFCALQSDDDGRDLYRSVVSPREFINAKDFGRGRDSTYGKPPYRYDEDAVDGRSHHDSRDKCRRESEFSIFGRHAPLMLPDATYEK